MKVCHRCKIEKSLNAFYKDRQILDGLCSHCKECDKKVWLTPEHKERRKHPRYKISKRKHKLKKFGLTLEDYEKMIKDQSNKCAICGMFQSEYYKEFSVDHSHSTGIVRGLLCNECNAGLGYFKDDVKILQKAIYYLVKK